MELTPLEASELVRLFFFFGAGSSQNLREYSVVEQLHIRSQTKHGTEWLRSSPLLNQTHPNSSSRYVHVDIGLSAAYMDPTVRMSYGHAGDLILFMK